MNKDRLQWLLKQFADGSIQRADYEELIQAVHLLQDEDTIYEGMDEVWHILKQNARFNDIHNEQLYHAIVSDERFHAPLPEPERKGLFRLLQRPWRQLAAGILVLGCVAALYFLLYPLKEPPVAQKVNWNQLAAPAGERKQFKMPDGSIVWLNAGSKLSYATTFNTNSREVFLEGEAFFDVVPNSAAPFIVHTGPVRTQVIGTAFNIQAYGKQALSVTVVRGKVTVTKNTTALATLTPNKQLRYTATGNQSVIQDVQAENFIAWKNGELILDDISMQEAAEMISRWYNVDLVFKNPKIKKCGITVSFLKGETIREVMEVMSRLNNFKYRTAGNQIIISGAGCP
jgi:transmembrane sensor